MNGAVPFIVRDGLGSNDELKRLALRVALDLSNDGLAEVRAPHERNQVGFHENRRRRPRHLDDPITALRKKLLDRRPRVEADMRFVHDADARVGEVATQERQPDGAMCDVRNRCVQQSTGAKEALRFLQQRHRIRNVLDDVGQDHGIEVRRSNRLSERVVAEVREDDALAECTRGRQRRFIAVDADHRVARIAQEACEIPGAAAEIEHVLSVTEHGQ